MSYLSLSPASEFEFYFYRREEGRTTFARGPLHRTWLNFRLKLLLKPRLEGTPIRAIRLRGKVQNVVIESLQVIPPESNGSRFDPFVHVQSTMYWQACNNIGESDAIDKSTKHHCIFSGPMRFDLKGTYITSSGVWGRLETLFFASLSYDSDDLFVKKLKDEIQRIPPTLYRKLVERQPDERLHDFPWLGVAYRMAEYLLSRNDLGEELITELRQSCRILDVKNTLVCARNIWFQIAEPALLQEVNYQLFMLQVVSRCPNFRLHYRIISPNDQADEAQEGWILPWQLKRFAYETEPFRSLVGLLAQYGPEQTIELHPPQNVDPAADDPHYYVCRWLLQYCGKLNEYNGYYLFTGYTHVASQVQLTFYL